MPTQLIATSLITRALLSREPPRTYHTREEEPEVAAKTNEDNLVRAILSYIAEHSPVEAKAPPATASAPTLRALFPAAHGTASEVVPDIFPAP